MDGTIRTRQKCPVCETKFIHDEKKGGFFCPDHPDVKATGQFVVKFGRKINKQFKDYKVARQFLNGIRFKSVENSLDPLDYRQERPNSFDTLAVKYLKRKGHLKSFSHIQKYINTAVDYFGQKNIKDIKGGDIEDFLFDIPTISEKTRHNYCTSLHDFFVWVRKRGGILTLATMPEFPKIDYELGYRQITDMDTQQAIADKIDELYSFNPKAGFAFRLLCTYTALRPGDLRRITEADYDKNTGTMFFRYPTKRKNQTKVIRLINEDKEHMNELIADHPGLPSMPIFRHSENHKSKEHQGCANEIFGKNYMYKIFKHACNELGIEGLDLYGATRHTTTTEIARQAGSENAKKASGHMTNKAFERYCQAQDETGFEMAKLIRRPNKNGKIIPINGVTSG